jgi:DNA-binding IclR family transcriptional regulator
MAEKNPIQVADKIFRAVEVLSEKGPLGVIELSEALELNKTTVYRILSSLEYMGYCVQDPQSMKYRLSGKWLQISGRLLEQTDIIDVVKPYLKDLSAKTGETVHLVQREGADAIYIDKQESPTNLMRLASRIGKKIPLYRSGVGKALLADLPDAEIEKIWEKSSVEKLTEKTIVDKDTLFSRLQEIRKTGYALDDEENERGVICVAISLLSTDSVPRYAISVSAPAGRMDADTIKKTAALLLNVKKTIGPIGQ